MVCPETRRGLQQARFTYIKEKMEAAHMSYFETIRKNWRFHRPDGAGGATPGESSAAGQEAVPPAQPSAQEGEQAEAKPGEGERTFTQAELEAIIAQRLGRANKKAGGAQQPAQSKMLDEMAEVERLASMTPEERAAHFSRRQQAQQEKDLAEREAALARRENRAEVLGTLGELGLPVEIAEVDLSDKETSAQSLRTLAPALIAWADKRAEARVMELTKGTTPRAGSAAAVEEIDLNAVFGIPPK